VLGYILLCIILKGQGSEIYNPAGNTVRDKVRKRALAEKSDNPLRLRILLPKPPNPYPYLSRRILVSPVFESKEISFKVYKSD
jgi:hypothetical protein